MLPDLTVQLVGAESGTPAWVTVLLSLGSTIVGAAISQVAGFKIEKQRAAAAFRHERMKDRQADRRNRREIRRTALAVAAELEALVKLIRFRQYIEGLTVAVEQNASGEAYLFVAVVGDNHLPVSNSAAATAGAFPGSIGTTLSEILALVRAAKLDLDELRNSQSPVHSQGARGYFHFYTELLTIVREIKRLAIATVREIDVSYETGIDRSWNAWGDADIFFPSDLPE